MFQAYAQQEGEAYDRDTLITAAQELMLTARYCAFISLDKEGHPQARTMDTFPPEKDMIVWLATNRFSRKVKELQGDSRVTLYFQVPQGYVSIKGEAILVSDKALTEKYWKEEWAEFYPKKEENYMLIKVLPKHLEIVSYVHGIVSDAPDWAAPMIDF